MGKNSGNTAMWAAFRLPPGFCRMQVGAVKRMAMAAGFVRQSTVRFLNFRIGCANNWERWLPGLARSRAEKSQGKLKISGRLLSGSPKFAHPARHDAIPNDTGSV